MVSLFSRFVTGGLVEVPVTDPRLVTHEDAPGVVSSDVGPAAQTEATPVEVAPASAEQISNSQ